MILPIHNKISRQWIFDNVSQEQIFAHYLGISPIVVLDCLNNNTLIRNPLRTDRTPTAGFYYRSGRIRFNDFAGYFHGDCFDLVGYIYLLSPYDKQDHARILEKVALDMGLITGVKIGNITRFDIVEKEDYDFEITPRAWTYLDEQYWLKRYEISVSQLNGSFTYPIEDLYINKKRVYTFHFGDPAYAYYIGPYKGKARWKIYFPKRTNYRFLTNTRVMDLLNTVKEAEYGIITQSRKAALVLHNLGVQAVALSGESALPLKNEINFLQSKWQRIITLLDFDYSGIKMSWLMRKVYNTAPAFIPNGKFNTLDMFPGQPDSQKLDIADYIDIYGSYYLNEIAHYFLSLQVEDAITELQKPSNDFIDLYEKLYRIEDEEETGTDDEEIPF